MPPDKSLQTLLIVIAVLSILLLIAAAIICIKIVHHANKQKQQKTQTEQQRYTIEYFMWTSCISSICDVLCCFSVSLYCVWIIFEPHQNLAWFITLRALPTVFWFVAKATLIWLYNGRLYYTFGQGKYRSSRNLFLIINVWIMVAIPLHLACGYIGAVTETAWMVSLGFEGFRVLYLTLTCYLLSMFSRKMLLLRARYGKVNPDSPPSGLGAGPVAGCADNSAVRSHQEHENTHTPSTINMVRKPTEQAEQRRKQPTETDDEPVSAFLVTTTKNAVLTLFISISAALTALLWIIWDFVLPSNYLTLLIPLMMFSLDSLINLCCIFLLRSAGKKMYSQLCMSMDICCRQCLFVACRQ